VSGATREELEKMLSGMDKAARKESMGYWHQTIIRLPV
jgi:hypothetical protein